MIIGLDQLDNISKIVILIANNHRIAFIYENKKGAERMEDRFLLLKRLSCWNNVLGNYGLEMYKIFLQWGNLEIFIQSYEWILIHIHCFEPISPNRCSHHPLSRFLIIHKFPLPYLPTVFQFQF